MLAAVPERADPRDALVGATLDDLPTGAVVATGSVRRRAQLAAVRPDLGFAELRGNIETRLDKAAGFDAIVVAAAALDRLGLADRIAERLETVGDAAASRPGRARGRVPRRRRRDARAGSRAIDDARAHARGRRASARSSPRSAAGATCPCGALAEVVDDGAIVVLEALLASLDGQRRAARAAASDDPDALGREAARRLLDERGGRRLSTSWRDDVA